MLTPRGSKKFLLSIIAPVCNEEGNLRNFYNQVKGVVDRYDYKYEFILIDDGSTDDSPLLLSKFANEDKDVKIITFARNFGHQMSITAGLDNAIGDAVVIIDSDLQDPPEVIHDLVEQWLKGYDIVNAKRRSRNDSFFKNFTADVFYKFLNFILTYKIPENVGDFRLIDRTAVDVLKNIREKDRYLRGLTNWVGFNQTFVLYDRQKRTSGESKYPLGKMLDLAFNAIFSFSRVPVRLAGFLAFSLIILAFLIAAYALASKLLNTVVPGWTSEMFIFSIFGAVQLFVLAIISEYVGRIYTQVQDRPLYVIAKKINFKSKPARTSS